MRQLCYHRKCVISGFHSEVAENYSLVGYYAASSGNFVRTFRDNLSVPSTGFKKPIFWIIYINIWRERKRRVSFYIFIYSTLNSTFLRSIVFEIANEAYCDIPAHTAQYLRTHTTQLIVQVLS